MMVEAAMSEREKSEREVTVTTVETRKINPRKNQLIPENTADPAVAGAIQ